MSLPIKNKPNMALNCTYVPNIATISRAINLSVLNREYGGCPHRIKGLFLGGAS